MVPMTPDQAVAWLHAKTMIASTRLEEIKYQKESGAMVAVEARYEVSRVNGDLQWAINQFENAIRTTGG